MSQSKQQRIAQSATDLAKEWADKGQLVKEGLAIFADLVIPPGAPPVQVVAMQFAFMAGAEHVWSSFMSILDGEERPETLLRRVELIQDEMDKWRNQMLEPANRPVEDTGRDA